MHPHTYIHLLKPPIPRHHPPTLHPLLLLPHHKLHQRLPIQRLPQFEILPVAITLVDAVDEHVHGEARGDELAGRQTDREALRAIGDGDKGLDAAVAVGGVEFAEARRAAGGAAWELDGAVEVFEGGHGCGMC